MRVRGIRTRHGTSLMHARNDTQRYKFRFIVLEQQGITTTKLKKILNNSLNNQTRSHPPVSQPGKVPHSMYPHHATPEHKSTAHPRLSTLHHHGHRVFFNTPHPRPSSQQS